MQQDKSSFINEGRPGRVASAVIEFAPLAQCQLMIVCPILGEQVGQVCVSLGIATNNVAEYTALVKGLEVM